MSAKAMLLMLVLLPTAAAIQPTAIVGGLTSEPVDEVTDLTGAVVADPVGATATLIDDAIECRDAVDAPVRGWGGRYTDERASKRAWRDVREVTYRTQTGTEPVIDIQRDVLWSPPAALAGLVDPIVRERPVVVGERPVYDTWTEEHAYRVDATWTERFLDWERVEYRVLLTPAAGLSYLAEGGEPVKVCDDRPVLGVVPVPEGYDRWSATPHYDRWVRAATDVDVRAATDADRGLPERRHVRHCPIDVLARADGMVDALVPDAVDGVTDAGSAPALVDEDASADTGSGAAPDGASATLVVPTSTGLAAGALGAAMLAVLGAVWLRRRG